MYADRGSTTRDVIEDVFELDDFNLPTGASLTTLVAEDIPLNTKQRRVVEKILSEALMWADHPYDPSKRQQSLLYVGGEGGVGKSQIVKAIVSGMDLIFRKQEVILMAPTGAAAENIGGSTYHTSLGISINRSQRTAMSSRVRSLWARKTIMIVDEVSMVDLGMLSVIDSHCKTARSLHRDSTDFFGGLPVVILMGDFFQFPPVRGPPLWKTPRNGKDEEQNGQLIWHQFKQVILLDEQMRQAGRRPALPRPSESRKIRHYVSSESRSDGAFCKVPRPEDLRLRGAPTNLRLHADDLLGLPEQGTKIPFPGLFLYSPAMPVALLTNICTHLGLVNGATGTAVGVVIDPTGKSISTQKSWLR
ncbi:hypothetical protein DTO027I6_10053 [Penicillium roqueforti]|nr:hypothetical protein CBS147337_10165 [Penicillium roqueforti]KAI3184028.1 hypothetical protein DTO027I6_10053 [Penicillium roqueforti]